MGGLQPPPLNGVVPTGPHHPLFRPTWLFQLCFSCLEALRTPASQQKDALFLVPSFCLSLMHFLPKEKYTSPFCVISFHENDCQYSESNGNNKDKKGDDV